MVDHLGLLIAAAISSGNCGDRDGLEALLYFNQGKYPNKLFADRGYKGREFREKLKYYGVDLETVKSRGQKNFVLEARRWIVERIFAWLGKNRRLSKDYELITTSSLSMIYLAMVRLMLRRIMGLN